MTRKLVTTATLVAVTAILGACGTSATKDTSTPSGTNRPAASSTPSSSSEAPEPAPSSEDTAEDADTLAFGETATFQDGLSVTVSAPKAFKPSEWAAGGKAKHNVYVTVTIVNKTGKPYDPSLFYATMQSANVEAETVFDTDNGLEGSPDTKVLNGREAKFKIGFNVTDPKDLVLEVAPGFDYNSVLYTTNG